MILSDYDRGILLAALAGALSLDVSVLSEKQKNQSIKLLKEAEKLLVGNLGMDVTPAFLEMGERLMKERALQLGPRPEPSQGHFQETTMTRKDYELIAAAIREQMQQYHPGPSSNSLGKAAIEATARSIASAMARENPRFDMPRFFAACGF